MRGYKMLLFLSCIIAGITAKDPPVMHYGMKSSSICLEVGKLTSHRSTKWNFGDTVIVDDQGINPRYKKKVKYNSETSTLCLNKLTEADGGTYSFYSHDANFTSSTKTHRLIVQETVPRPVLRLSVLHSSPSTGFCNVTVNCSIQSEWLRSICDEDSCRASQRSFDQLNITTYNDNRTIVCRGNNYVSTSNNSASMDAICFSEANPEEELKPLVIVIIIIMCAFICLCTPCFATRISAAQSTEHEAETAAPDSKQRQPAEERPRPGLNIPSSNQPDSECNHLDTTWYHQTTNTAPPEAEKPHETNTTAIYCLLQCRTYRAVAEELNKIISHVEPCPNGASEAAFTPMAKKKSANPGPMAI
ncbi:uncharacterized protein LOC117504769 [Thalassophryne amazonica]|uniref:uncharacterized protein LOC117504769 n=1 Tax=Thalassophryne amazonica TaxID=390379 RepID=UPI001471C1BE|nr:uncharacterized protein LOC117504769 [Thalassophryne amazonica]